MRRKTASVLIGILAVGILAATSGLFPRSSPALAAAHFEDSLSNNELSTGVTRVVFEEPRSLDEVAVLFSDARVVQLRYAGDVGGVSIPESGQSAILALRQIASDARTVLGFSPLVFAVIVEGLLTSSQRSRLPSAAEEKAFAVLREAEAISIGQAVRAEANAKRGTKGFGTPTAEVSADKLQSPQKDNEARNDAVAPQAAVPQWAPRDGWFRAYNWNATGNKSAAFDQYMTWDSQADLAAFGDDFGYEHNMSLYNYQVYPGIRPSCRTDAYTDFWARWKLGDRSKAVDFWWDFPAAAAPYWDWDDDSDACSKLDFTVGVGYPNRLQPNVEYHFSILAGRGTRPLSGYELAAQKISNDCNDINRDPGSECMGLNDTRPGSGTVLLVGEHRQWTVPGCAIWKRGEEPVRHENGDSSGWCLANHPD